MARNLDNRVELVAPVDDPLATAEIQTVLDLQLADTALAWELGSDGSWSRVTPPEGAEPVQLPGAAHGVRQQAGPRARRETGPASAGSVRYRAAE